MKLSDDIFFKTSFLYPLNIAHADHAPVCPGVYIITTTKNSIEYPIYIGASKCLRYRFISHPTIQKLRREKVKHKLYVIPCILENVSFNEKSLIMHFKPVLNKQHNDNNKFRTINNKKVFGVSNSNRILAE